MGDDDVSHKRFSGGIRDFIGATGAIGNVIIGATSQKDSFVPLPFTDTSLFEENYGALVFDLLL